MCSPACGQGVRIAAVAATGQWTDPDDGIRWPAVRSVRTRVQSYDLVAISR